MTVRNAWTAFTLEQVFCSTFRLGEHLNRLDKKRSILFEINFRISEYHFVKLFWKTCKVMLQFSTILSRYSMSSLRISHVSIYYIYQFSLGCNTTYLEKSPESQVPYLSTDSIPIMKQHSGHYLLFSLLVISLTSRLCIHSFLSWEKKTKYCSCM